ncbi:Protein MRPL-23 [Aphelenchoides avenae]|nr:Protein MRPL-23 [Aphelenchus avenae]
MFEVDPRMTKWDVRQYLEKIYQLPVRDVRIRNVLGEIEWQNKRDQRYKRALWKDEDKKIAYVFFKKGTDAIYPNVFPKMEDETEEELAAYKKEAAKDLTNEKYPNRDRAGVGTFFGI